jgi:hypothetical protein
MLKMAYDEYVMRTFTLDVFIQIGTMGVNIFEIGRHIDKSLCADVYVKSLNTSTVLRHVVTNHQLTFPLLNTGRLFA